jgi:RNA polymerase sigma-70 factor (ECF subfamily)
MTGMGAAIYWFSILLPTAARELARGLRRRDPQLLERLIEQYQYRLFRYLLYLTASREIAEDLFQETWMRVLEHGDKYDGQSKFETWLFAIARHLVIDWQRQKKLQSLDALAEPEGTRSPLEVEDLNAASPLDLVSSRQEEGHVRASLNRLPAAYREVLLLRFQEDLGLEEIAAVLSAPLSTVKSRLYRSLEALRELLEGGSA